MKTCFAQNRATVTSAESFFHVELLLEDDDDDDDDHDDDDHDDHDDDDHDDDDHVYFQMIVLYWRLEACLVAQCGFGSWFGGLI